MLKAGGGTHRGGNRGERGQALLLFVGAFTVILVIAAITIDFGLWMAERRSLQRAADLAAAAGALDLPASSQQARQKAIEWVANNDVDVGDGVVVETLCYNTLSSPPAGICTNTNPPGGGPIDCPYEIGCDSLRVTISKPSSRLFTSLLGIAGIDVGATASAGVMIGSGGGFAVGPQQTVILIDAQGRMGNSCRTLESCAIALARDEATALADLLLDGGGQRQVGYAPYTYCYEPPLHASYECVLDAGSASPHVVGLTSAGSALHTAIDATYAHGGAVASVCLPLLKAVEMFNAQPSSLPRAVVILTDGDNRYDHISYYDQIPYPPAPCRPSPSNESLPTGAGTCEGPFPEERELDVLTKQVANSLEAQGAEIYVVGLQVCGPDDGKTKLSPGYCNGIGDAAHDNVADQRLLKCIASSPEHYTSVSVAELPGTFQQIALAFSNRGLLQ